jgi:diguanylate cyclase (GGDEF)-like protein
VKRWKDDRFEGFNRSRGLPGEDCVGQAMLVEPGGDVWVGTSSGIARFNAKAYRGPVPVPPARITLIKDGGGKVHEPSPEALEVAYRFRSMDFEFECLSFVDEAHLRPEVRLMGFEDPWRDAGGRATRFTTLPPGRYVFAVRFVDANGQPGPEATQAIFVLKPWWQTWWFFGLLAIALAALVAALVRWRTNLLKRRTRELEKIVERRTHDLQAANQALEEASMADALTGLKNRRYLQLYLPEDEAQVQRAYRTAASQNAPARGEDLGLLLVDLDHFKAVNDTHGHAAGDAVLKQAAELLLGVCRETDAVARWGGEEFLVVARRVERGAMDSIARKIRDAFENHPFVLPDGGVIRKTCSLGFAVHPLNPLDPGAFRWEETLEAADLCLYAAKKSGRNAWVGVFGDPERHGDPGPMRVVDLPELVRADRLELRSSLPADEINWSA